jgi:glycosyltransferase involved in cell wall biosynthesis
MICHPTGVGQFALGMINALAAEPAVACSLVTSKHEYSLASGSLAPAAQKLPVSYLSGNEFLVRNAAIYTSFPALDRWCPDADWLYVPREMPVATRKAKLALMVHDVRAFDDTALRMGWASRARYKARWWLTFHRLAERADVITTNSEYTAQKLAEVFPAARKKRTAIVGCGVSPAFFRMVADSDNEILAGYGVRTGSFILVVGSLTWRKGGDTVLRLAGKAPARLPGVEILVTGRRHDANLASAAGELHDGGKGPVRLLGYVPQTDLAVLLTHALALYFPSRYEGFGMPALEAMAAGAPVVASRAAALPEIVGDAGILLADRDSEDEAIDRFSELQRAALSKEELRGKGRRRAADFTWERCRDRLLDCLRAS